MVGEDRLVLFLQVLRTSVIHQEAGPSLEDRSVQGRCGSKLEISHSRRVQAFEALHNKFASETVGGSPVIRVWLPGELPAQVSTP